MKRLKNKTIHSKFFVNMSNIAIIFMLLLFIFISVLFYKYFLELESDASLKQLDYISSQLDYYLTSVKNYSKTIIVDSSVQDYMNKYNKEKYTFDAKEQIHLKGQISRIIQSTPFIHSVTIYSPEKHLVVTTEPFPLKTKFSKEHISSEGFFLSTTKHSKSNSKVEIKALSLLRPIYNYNSGALLGYIEMVIPEQMISNIYRDKSTERNTILLTDSLGYIRSSIHPLSLGQKYILFSLAKNFSDKEFQLTKHSILFVKYFTSLDWYIINQISLFEFIKPMVPIFTLTFIITIICILACLYVSHRISKSITSPIASLVSHIKTIEAGNWTPLEEVPCETEIGMLFSSFNSMIIAQEKLKNDLLETQKMKAKIFLDLLQEQVNPHFLYNTLDNICSLAEIDEKETLINLVMNLSTFYREGLSNGKFYITLKEELEITEAYLNIMQIRYYNKLDYSIQCPKTLWNYSCLKLLLQPIVENSIYHGIKELGHKGYLEIIVTEEKNKIQIVVQDNGKGISPDIFSHILESQSDHFGIKNIHNRIQLYYGESYGLHMKNRPGGGCQTIITIGKEGLENVNSSFIG